MASDSRGRAARMVGGLMIIPVTHGRGRMGPNYIPVRRVRRGLGACVRQYYKMPDAATLAALESQGCSVEIISDPNPHPPGYGTFTTYSGPTIPAPAPYHCEQIPPGLEQCDPWDNACAQRNVAKSVANQQNCAAMQADYNRQMCKHNASLNGQDPAPCDVAWPAGYQGDLPATMVSNPNLYINPGPYQQVSTTIPPVATPSANLPAVVATPAQKAAAAAQTLAETVGHPSAGGTPASSAFDLQSIFTGRFIDGIPNWLLLAGAGALFFFGRGHGR